MQQHHGDEAVQPLPPVLRLPIEIRVEIALLLQEPNPMVSEAAQAHFLENFLLGYNKRRKNARAILEVPGFQRLKKRYPHTFEGRDAALYAYQCQWRLADWYSLVGNESANGIIYQPSGLHPLFSRFLRAASTESALESWHPGLLHPEPAPTPRRITVYRAFTTVTKFHLIVEANEPALRSSLVRLLTHSRPHLHTLNISILINKRATKLGRRMDHCLVDPRASFPKIIHGVRWFEERYVDCFYVNRSGITEVVLEVWKKEARSLITWTRDEAKGKWTHSRPPDHHGRRYSKAGAAAALPARQLVNILHHMQDTHLSVLFYASHQCGSLARGGLGDAAGVEVRGSAGQKLRAYGRSRRLSDNLPWD